MTKRIVIGSVLKPLDDVRHFYKLGKTLASLPDVHVFILARNASSVPSESNITLKAITSTSSTLFNRYLAPLRFLVQLFQLHPTLVIVSTHELLRVAVLGKLFGGYKLVYDVQENYRLNIKTNKTYKGLFQKLFLFDVWLSETIAKPFVNQYWLAEACYSNELSLPSNKTFVFENKALSSQKVVNVSFEEKKEITLLFSGTVAEENGIWESITLVDKLHGLDPRYRLHVVGCCHQSALLEKLRQATKGKNHIHLEVLPSPLPYPILLKAIQQADIGLIAYRNQANFSPKMPTKLFEYLALGKPILLPPNPLWLDYLAPFQCGIVVEFRQLDEKKLHSQLTETVFYPEGNEAPSVMWTSLTEKLVGLGATLLS